MVCLAPLREPYRHRGETDPALNGLSGTAQRTVLSQGRDRPSPEWSVWHRSENRIVTEGRQTYPSLVSLAPLREPYCHRGETDQVLNGLSGTAKPPCRDKDEEGVWCGSRCRIIHHSVGTATDVADLALGHRLPPSVVAGPSDRFNELVPLTSLPTSTSSPLPRT